MHGSQITFKIKILGEQLLKQNIRSGGQKPTDLTETQLLILSAIHTYYKYIYIQFSFNNV